RWFAEHGRHDLPWQRDITPYRVWLSEIMLQQTQVATVIPYFERFTEHFPTLESLAGAKLDQVLHLWTGLGYYARARNLHRTAQIVMTDHGGEFPGQLQALTDLPGIGRSTAGAILAMAFQEPATILDGNVKRVLTRVYAIDGWPGHNKTQQALWRLAEQNTPARDAAAYAQAIMDLGATVCVRSNPDCVSCPLDHLCEANKRGQQQSYPAKRPRAALPVKQAVFAIVLNDEREVLLQQRPAPGIWGGLWCLPEFPAMPECEYWLAERFAVNGAELEVLDLTRHTFSHFHLDITPVKVHANRRRHTINDTTEYLWYQAAAGLEIGMAAPVLRLLKQYT
ncbi:MAG: A/G-specific adenine glycosylase, partial [Gammaproteobacteria bacterium]